MERYTEPYGSTRCCKVRYSSLQLRSEPIGTDNCRKRFKPNQSGTAPITTEPTQEPSRSEPIRRNRTEEPLQYATPETTYQESSVQNSHCELAEIGLGIGCQWKFSCERRPSRFCGLLWVDKCHFHVVACDHCTGPDNSYRTASEPAALGSKTQQAPTSVCSERILRPKLLLYSPSLPCMWDLQKRTF